VYSRTFTLHVQREQDDHELFRISESSLTYSQNFFQVRGRSQHFLNYWFLQFVVLLKNTPVICP